MAITLVRSQSASSATNGTTASLTISVTPTAGNLLVAIVNNSVANSNGTPTGWTAGGTATDVSRVSTFWKISNGAETTVSSTLGGSSAWNVHYMEFTSSLSGWTTAVTQSATTIQQTATTAMAVASVTPSMPVAVMVATVSYTGTLGTPSWSNSYVAVASTASTGTVCTLQTAYKIVTAGGAQTTTDTNTVSAAYVAVNSASIEPSQLPIGWRPAIRMQAVTRSTVW